MAISTKEQIKGRWRNSLTREMDKHLRYTKNPKAIYTYVHGFRLDSNSVKIGNILPIRVGGLDRGQVHLSDDGIVKKITIFDLENSCYTKGVQKSLKKFYKQEMVFVGKTKNK